VLAVAAAAFLMATAATKVGRVAAANPEPTLDAMNVSKMSLSIAVPPSSAKMVWRPQPGPQDNILSNMSA